MDSLLTTKELEIRRLKDDYRTIIADLKLKILGLEKELLEEKWHSAELLDALKEDNQR